MSWDRTQGWSLLDLATRSGRLLPLSPAEQCDAPENCLWWCLGGVRMAADGRANNGVVLRRVGEERAAHNESCLRAEPMPARGRAQMTCARDDALRARLDSDAAHLRQVRAARQPNFGREAMCQETRSSSVCPAAVGHHLAPEVPVEGGGCGKSTNRSNER